MIIELSELDIESLAKMLTNLRDSFESGRIALDEYLMTLYRSDVGEWDPSKIVWEETEGSKGPYERAKEQDCQDFILLLKELEVNEAHLTKDGVFYWKFDHSNTIGRKKMGGAK